MAVQTATIALANQADFLAAFKQLYDRVQEHSPGVVRTTTLTVVTDTAGTIVTTLTDGRGVAITKSFAAAVA